MNLVNNNLFNQLQKLKYLAKTRIAVDIQNLGKNTKCIAVPEKSSLHQIYKSVWLKKDSANFSKNNFTNIYDLFWNSKDIHLVPEIYSSNTPYCLADQIEEDKNIISVINGGFFFLTDVAERTPLDLPYNLCIRDTVLFGLPSCDLPVVYVKNGQLNAQDTKALGTIMIGNKKITWVGANSKQTKKSNSAVLYNSECSDIVKIRDTNNIQIGILDNKNIYTPQNSKVVDIVVGKDKNNNLVITHINQDGHTHFFDGLFILQIKKTTNTYRVGDLVKPLTLDHLKLEGITSAITVGMSVHNPFFYEEVRVDRQDARSLIAKDAKGNIHFIVFDGSKYVPGFNGVSAKEISSYFSADKFEWAYFLDGGGSTRTIARDRNKLQYFANEFAFRKLDDGTMLWDWQKARQIASSIILRVQKN